MISLGEFLMGRTTQYPISDELRDNAVATVNLANQLMAQAGILRGVRSGYRPAEINAKVPGASPTSKHMTCQAVDLEDCDGKLKSWCMKNQDCLIRLGLYMESPETTATWAHIQIVPPHSGHRIFFP